MNQKQIRENHKDRIEEIKKTRLWTLFDNTFYKHTLGTETDNGKKVDSQQITRCAFAALCYVLRTHKNETNSKTLTSTPFTVKLEIKSNITDPDTINHLVRCYKQQKSAQNTSKTEHSNSPGNTYSKFAKVFTESTLKRLTFNNYKKSDDEESTIWSFDWQIQENKTPFIWIKDAYGEGTWDTFDIVDSSMPQNDIKDNDNIQLKNKKKVIELDHGKCNLFKALEMLYETYKNCTLSEIIKECMSSELIMKHIDKASESVLQLDSEKRDKSRSEIDNDILALIFKMNLKKLTESSLITSPYFYPWFRRAIVRKWCREMITDVIPLITHINENDPELKDLENRQRMDKLLERCKFIPSTTSSIIDTKRPQNNSGNVSDKTKKKFLYNSDKYRKKKRRKTKILNVHHRQKKQSDQQTSKPLMKEMENEYENLKRKQKLHILNGYVETVQDTITRSRINRHTNSSSSSSSSSSLSNVEFRQLGTKLAEQWSGSENLGQMITSSLSTPKNRLRIVSMHEVFFFDLMIYLLPLLCEENRIIKEKVLRRFKDADPDEKRVPQTDVNEYISKFPSMLTMTSVRCFYGTMIVSSDLFKSVIIKNYNKDTNHKRQPVSSSIPKAKIPMETIHMNTVKKTFYKNRRLIYDNTRIMCPGGPPENGNILPIECRDKRTEEQYAACEDFATLSDNQFQKTTETDEPQKNDDTNGSSLIIKRMMSTLSKECILLRQSLDNINKNEIQRLEQRRKVLDVLDNLQSEIDTLLD